VPLALSLANGAVYVSIGLLACLDNEAQVAMVIASEVARVLSEEDLRRLRDDQHRADARFLPELLSALALGLADRSLSKQDAEAQQAYEERLDAEADAAGLDMLRKAGYSPGEVPALYENLAALGPSLAAKPSGNFGDPVRLAARRAALTSRIEAWPEPERRAGDVGRDAYTGFRRDLLLAVARRLAAQGKTPEAGRFLDARDSAAGPDGPGAYLRAEMARRTARSTAEQDAAHASLKAATAYPDVPVAAFRELGFAHRRRGEPELAQSAFAEYLKRNPDAVDAPIIRGYLENQP
jgi:hypothetical protein